MQDQTIGQKREFARGVEANRPISARDILGMFGDFLHVQIEKGMACRRWQMLQK